MKENWTATDTETRRFGRGSRVYIKVQGALLTRMATGTEVSKYSTVVE